MTRRGFLGLIGTVVGAVATGGVAKILVAPPVEKAIVIDRIWMGEKLVYDRLNTPMIFPLVRRVYPAHIMNEVACVHPFEYPRDGKVFYLDALDTPTT